ncbi:hypothetical protein BFL38_04585 [Brachyspira hampsonii]|uniref:Uncharacterized protein n=1 Tax=Brachyspira hampsonii TaxID=1287055 RepID=A0A1E5NCX2_9SPIR|nr:hypothetical protein [Brachyspira hampsonii]OEJ14018.1 hypothetical protein BFL38_04585 [Brachyspira hampsonii]
MKKTFYIILLSVLFFTLSCKKVNLLSPSIIPPPTEFPNNGQIPQYPIPSPALPIPPDKIEEKYIVVTPEIVQNGTVFGGYSRRFKFNNEWHILATNEYQYDPNTKRLSRTGKGAVLKIDNNGKTITKVYGLSLGDDLEKKEYWTNLNSKKVIMEPNRVTIPTAGTYGMTIAYQEKKYEYKNVKFYNDRFRYIPEIYLNVKGKATSDLINWADSPDFHKKVYKLPELNFDNPNFQGRIGTANSDLVLLYFEGKFLLFIHPTIYDYYKDGFIPPSNEDLYLDSKYYYTLDLGKDSSDPKNWITNEAPWGKRYLVTYFRYDGYKMYASGGNTSKYVYDSSDGYWYLTIENSYAPDAWDGIWGTKDGINWEREMSSAPFKNAQDIAYFFKENPLITYKASDDGTPFEPEYTELNGIYYRTFNTTYPIPPVKEIMQTAERFETNFTITEEHVKNSGIYQIQMSYVHPDNAKESDWITIVPNNQITSSTAWESGGAALFTFNGKLVRLVDYDREFKLNTQYEEALNLSKQYYSLLETRPISEYKNNCYYFLYYKAMADMIKIIKDKSNDYFRPEEAFTHYTFEIN